LALINTLLGMVIDTNTMQPRLAGKTGGLSGPAIRPIAVRAIYQVHQVFPQTPIVGMGGVSTGRDAFELILAGASAVSIGTANFGNPTAAISVKHELSTLLTQHGFKNFNDAVGYAHRSN
jgi:dihydroorotate dehydrogenase (NAD+) catalytic subunit